ncbi:YciI family protein [Arthrobacter sp. ok909]|uniref:YciI family protein n=1 Tax=Arthrobacter sp. ok909 TaxID=1761746 RepID=UPI0034A473A5
MGGRDGSAGRRPSRREGRGRGLRWAVCGDKEWIAGYDVIACADLDEAIEVASTHPMAPFGKIEIRPVWPLGL